MEKNLNCCFALLFLLTASIIALCVINPVTAEPSYSPNDGKMPLEVTFSFPGGESCDKVIWHFEEGVDKVAVSPKYTYKEMGMYYPECVATLPGAEIHYYFDKITVRNADMSKSSSYDAHKSYKTDVIASVDGLSFEDLIKQADGLAAFSQPVYASTAYKAALNLKASDPELLAKYAANLISLNQLSEAEDIYIKSINLNKDPIVITAYGYLLLSMNKPEEAVEIFNQALEIDSANTDALTGLGDAKAALGEHDEAVDKYKTALAINGNLPVTLKDFGDTLMELDRFDEAATTYKSAIDNGVSGSEIWYSYGNALIQSGEESEGLKAKEIARSYAPAINIFRGHDGIPVCMAGAL